MVLDEDLVVELLKMVKDAGRDPYANSSPYYM